jgi:hypothetical protein
MHADGKVSRSLLRSKSAPPEPILPTVPQVLPYSCRSLGSHRKVSEYQEWAFSSRPGNRARDKATVPASRTGGMRPVRGKNPPCSLSPIPIHLAAFSDTRRKRMPSSTRIQKASTIELDFRLENHGSLFLLRPLNPVAQNWMSENLPVDDPETQFWGDAIVIETRYVASIVDGIIGDGLVLR